VNDILFPESELPEGAELPSGKKGTAIARAQNLTHGDVAKLCSRWLRNNGYLTFCESGAISYNGGCEIADVIGWNTKGISALIEAKVSRADFRRDKEKNFRKFADLGFGVLRYFAVPAGLVLPAEVPAKWGLLWCYENRIIVKTPPKPFDYTNAAIAERKLLGALLHRVDADCRRAFETLGWNMPGRYD
jgi:hypothetical protein